MSQRRKPPILAEAIVRWLATPEHRDALLGDLNEEFALNAARNRRYAARAYWSQTLRSLPHLALWRWNASGWLAFTVVTSLAVGLIYVWDLAIARRTAMWLAARPDAPALTTIRIAYFAVQAAGTALAGAAIARWTFRSADSLTGNVVKRLLPISAGIAATLLAIALVSGGGPLRYWTLKILLTVVALFVGAAVSWRLRISSR
ncbi:MAG: hypothetical protein AAFX44_00295 [Pseudomonadota bacterium]